MAAWFTESPIWEGKFLNLLLDGSVKPVPSPSLDELIERSKKFPINFCTDTIKCETIRQSVDPAILQRNIDTVYPLIHESVLHLYAQFLVCKLEYGSKVERKQYKKMTLLDFVQRLLTKKAVFFAGPHDSYQLLSGPVATGGWETVGTDIEKEPLVLRNRLSYDEMKLSALLSISSYSYFTNDGSRAANGSVARCRDNIQPEGVIISIIGARLHKPGYMDFQDIVNGGYMLTRPPYDEGTVRKLFSNFYGENLLTYNKLRKAYKSDKKRFIKIRVRDYFDNQVFAKRLIVSFDTLLLEANHRARQNGKMAYVYVVGIGLGTWSVSAHQLQVFADVFADRLSILEEKLTHVSDVDLANIPSIEFCGKYKNQDVISICNHPTGIKIHISKREPFVKLEDPDKLLVVSYAADANSLPGNEFWVGCPANSSDSTTASSTQISELHNPHINPRVNVGNLQVITCAGPLVSIQEYVDRIKRQF